MKIKIKDVSYLDVYKDKLQKEAITDYKKSSQSSRNKRFNAEGYSYIKTLIAREIKKKALAKYGFNSSLVSLTQEEEKTAFAYFWVAMEIALRKKEGKPVVLSAEQAEAWWWNATNDYKQHREERNTKDLEHLKAASKAFEKIDSSYKPRKLIKWTNLEGNYAYFEEGAWRK